MLITIPMILDKLSNKVLDNEKVFSNRETNIQKVSLLHSPLAEYKDNTLYLLPNSLSVEDFNSALPMNLLYIQDECGFYTGKSFKNQSILILKDIRNVQELISEIQDIIQYYREMFDRLLSLVGDDVGIQSLTNAISAYLMNPVAIFARGSKLLAHSQNNTMDYKPWIETEEKGYLIVDPKISNLLKEQSKISEKNNSPFIFFAEGMNYKIATKTIMKQNEKIGIFRVVEYNQPITQGTLDMMEAMNLYLAIELNKKELIHFNNGLLNGQLIIDLLEKKVDNLESLKNRSKNLGWLFAKYLFILTIKPTSRFLVGEQLSKIRNQLKVILPISNCLVYDKGVVAIINKNTDSPYNNEAEILLLALLKEWNLRCGLSQCSTNILDAARLYKQSLQAIKLGLLFNPGCIIYNYSDFALYDFFDNCLQNENISSYYHPVITDLKKYDTKHNTDLLNTLENYINNHNNQMYTAKKMHIHRSTLLYRINKIQELTSIDFDNPDTIFHLKLSLKLSEYERLLSSQPV